MSEPILLALVATAGAILGALIAQFAPIRRAPAQARLDDANAEKAQHEASALVNKELRAEIARLSIKVAALESHIAETDRQYIAKVKELEGRLATSEQRNTQGEIRQAQSDTRDNERQRVIHVLGEKLDAERADNLRTTDQLCILIERLLVCIESPSEATKIDMPGVQAMIRNIRSGTPHH